MRIGGNKVFRLTVQVGEVAAAAAGNQNLFADTFGAFENGYAASALASLDGAHEAGCASAENDDVDVVGHVQSMLLN